MNLRSWALRHAQTLVGSLGRMLEAPLATLMTMTVIAIALALPLLLSIFLWNVKSATAHWNQALDISVYMDKRADAARAQAVAQQLRSRPDVLAVRVITADEALAQFRSVSGFGSALDALRDNPLPDTLVVTPALLALAPHDLEALKTAIAALADVQTVQVDTQWVTRLQGIMVIVNRVVWLIGALLGVGIVLGVGNTIRLDILNRRSEIEVMKLVGATDGFARRPFLYSGVWYGLGGGLLALALCTAAVGLLRGPVERLAGLYDSAFQLRGFGWTGGVAVVGLAVMLGWLGSWLAATRHIRAIAPT
jgi:cell division transport system permease protein